ncbi:hypothetical protein BOTBODRAFT_189521 [Botryobasidium botryosum FD-172 SS1]|uniref:Uncharacterized protein n=1 Tax=Botryobasidium botryosum (strain FD-172 SS1) TaxID=930990 RepID=A0A067M8C9_BOTB1|nr:hypothetical protein BOTBODRAFT_189521 [Botryobasidium botryosum FD-172 SS1]
MDAIALNLVPRLIRELYERSLAEDADINRESIWKPPIYDLNTHFHLPNTAGVDAIEHMDKELGLVTMTCKYAARALLSYTETMPTMMKRRRNHHLPIYRLSDEVLAMIFQFAVESSSNRARPLTKKAPFNVSHVSYRWREAATTTPRLWRKYDASAVNARIADIILDRSKGAPLHIELARCDPASVSDDEDPEDPRARFSVPLDHVDAAYNKGARDFPDFIRPLLPHADRWEEVILEGINGILWEHLCFPAPSLKRLQIKAANDAFGNPPTHIFGGSTPLLRDLRLRTRGPPLASLIYAGLTTLMLDFIIYDAAVQDFLNVLAGCPRLQRLKLKDLGFDPPGDSSPPCIDIHLPYLEEVVIYALAEDAISDLLSSITASPTVRVAMEDSGMDAIFRSSLFSSNVSPICWAHFKRHYSVALDAGDFQHGCRIDLASMPPRRVTSDFPRDLPVQSLGSLAFEGYVLDHTPFSKFLADFPSIISITLSDSTCPLVDALVVTPSSNLCPLLKELRLQRVAIVKETLLEFARSRTAGNKHTRNDTHLTRLVFSNCPGLDLSTTLELRSLSLQVRVLPPGSQIEEIRFSCAQD